MLDVYEHYRLQPGHPLLSLDNAVLTPHLAGMTRESRAAHERRRGRGNACACWPASGRRISSIRRP